MPAAAILVNPADAVDCEFLNLDFLKDARLFTACYCCLIFYFHVILLSFFFAPLPRCAVVCLLYCNANANKYNADLQSYFKHFKTEGSFCIPMGGEKQDTI